MRYKKRLYEFEKSPVGLVIKKYLAADDSSVTSITIPSTYEGLFVPGAGFEAFADARFLRSVTIPDSVSILGGGVFRGCTALENVCVPRYVEKVPAAAFLGCTVLKAAELSEGIRSISPNAFRDCTSLESIVFPESLQSIESCAFLGTPKLPPEIILMGLLRSPDLSRQIKVLHDIEWDDALRPDVFSLALKLGSFNNGDITEQLLFRIAERGPIEDFELAARAGLLDNAELTDKLLEHSARFQNAETAAWLLEYGRKKFGFDPEDKYEL